MEQIVKLTTQTNENMLVENPVCPTKENRPFHATPSRKNKAVSEALSITFELLDGFLYGKRKIQSIDIEEAKRQKTTQDLQGKKNIEKETKRFSIWCEMCRSRHEGPCHVHESLQTLRQLVGTTVHDIKLTYAVLSFPSEVQMCTSSIPGFSYGVSAKQPFPVGTWIGPYEGRRIRAEEMTVNIDTDYVWEIYEDSKFSHYLDGNDENCSSWMRYIRCARHKGEQNMVVFQYANNIYYRAVRDIPVGTELLVWYNNNYTQFLGIPLGLRNVPGSKKSQEKFSSAEQAPKLPPPKLPPPAPPTPVTHADIKPIKEENKENTNNPATAAYNNVPEVVYSSRQMQTNTTYCYSATNPSGFQAPAMFSHEAPTKNLAMVQPTITIEHRPPVTNATFSQNHTTSPGVTQHQQYVTPHSGSSPITSNQSDSNNNHFMFTSGNQPPITCSTTSVSIFQDNNVSPHNERGSWKCNRCLKTFEQRSLLQMHACCKSPDKPYQCGHCSDSFAQPTELRNHVVSHSNDRPFKCGLCGRSFAGAATLNNHMRTHTGERPFLCQNCGRTFSIATQLSRHMRTPGECPMAGNISELHSEVEPPYTSTMTRG